MKLTVNPSIRTQLLAWLVIPILVLLLVGAALTYGLAIGLATDAYDKALLDSVYSVANCVHYHESDGHIVVDLPPAALAILKDDIKDRVFYQVLDEKLQLLSGDSVLPIPKVDTMDDLTSADYRDGIIGGEDIRIALIKYPVRSPHDRFVYIQVAETLHGREQIGEQILVGVILPQLAMVVISGLVLWFGVTRGLRPLTSVRDAVASRSPLDLRPISVDYTPREVRPLVTAINDLLELLHEDMQAQRRFVANAAHQLRTPIAGLKMQSELALRQSKPEEIRHALNLINLGADRAARLANQLLALARAEPGAVNPALWQRLDLNKLGKNVSRELVTQAIAKNIDLGFEESDVPVWIRGDQASLHELSSNLIENAILYTPSGGRVTVRTFCKPGAGDGQRSCIAVEDNGPGIPAAEREKVFERFYRVSDRGVAGSGLGLAIVREIAKIHGADVQLSDGPNGAGTSVLIEFPYAPKDNPVSAASSANASVTVSTSATKPVDGDKILTGSSGAKSEANGNS
ncbi:MAG TPA: sensor histidine kinase N-terminal domain-containing protein [Oculatellaceae cyanobacterium]